MPFVTLFFFLRHKRHIYIIPAPPDSWQVFLHIINIFLLLFYIYKTALLPGVLRRSEICCHKSPLPTLSLHTCLVGNFICKRPGSARFEALHEKPGKPRVLRLCTGNRKGILHARFACIGIHRRTCIMTPPCGLIL